MANLSGYRMTAGKWLWTSVTVKRISCVPGIRSEIARCAVICGADDFVSIALGTRMKTAWPATFLDLSAGIPSHDRFNATVAAAGWNDNYRLEIPSGS
jgi:hypothetical protein